MHCPLVWCTRSVQNVVRHMQEFHKYDEEKAKGIFQHHAERYRKNSEGKEYKQCPDCPSRVIRLDTHRRLYCGARKKKKTEQNVPPYAGNPEHMVKRTLQTTLVATSHPTFAPANPGRHQGALKM